MLNVTEDSIASGNVVKKELVPVLNVKDFELALIPPSDYKYVYFPDWTNRPAEYPPVITLNGTGVLTYQNISAIIAAPGLGKTSVCEGVIASYLNAECD